MTQEHRPSIQEMWTMPLKELSEYFFSIRGTYPGRYEVAVAIFDARVAQEAAKEAARPAWRLVGATWALAGVTIILAIVTLTTA